MKFDILNRYTSEVQFTAEIDCTDDAGDAVKKGLAVIWAIENNANLDGANLDRANLCRANLDGANLCRASLCRANLDRASLCRASLDGASLYRANLDRASLDRASLDGASLYRASLDGVIGLNDWIKCMQIETYAIAYTADVIQIGCQRHTHAEWASFSGAQIRAMDGVNALNWWRKWKKPLFNLIALAPAKPTGFVQEAAE